MNFPKICCKNVGGEGFVSCDKPAAHWYLHNNQVCSYCPEHNYQCGEPVNEKSRLPITHVAIRFRGEIYSLPKPNRHHHVIRYIVDNTDAEYVDADEDDQGFLDCCGRFLRRKPALINARLHNQLRTDNPVYDRLYSENLW